MMIPSFNEAINHLPRPACDGEDSSPQCVVPTTSSRRSADNGYIYMVFTSGEIERYPLDQLDADQPEGERVFTPNYKVLHVSWRGECWDHVGGEVGVGIMLEVHTIPRSLSCTQ